MAAKENERDAQGNSKLVKLLEILNIAPNSHEGRYLVKQTFLKFASGKDIYSSFIQSFQQLMQGDKNTPTHSVTQQITGGGETLTHVRLPDSPYTQTTTTVVDQNIMGKLVLETYQGFVVDKNGKLVKGINRYRFLGHPQEESRQTSEGWIGVHIDRMFFANSVHRLILIGTADSQPHRGWTEIYPPKAF